jgi:hypothetical protein
LGIAYLLDVARPRLHMVAGLAGWTGETSRCRTCRWESLAWRSSGDRAHDGWATKTQLNQTRG